MDGIRNSWAASLICICTTHIAFQILVPLLLRATRHPVSRSCQLWCASSCKHGIVSIARVMPGGVHRDYSEGGVAHSILEEEATKTDVGARGHEGLDEGFRSKAATCHLPPVTVKALTVFRRCSVNLLSVLAIKHKCFEKIVTKVLREEMCSETKGSECT